MSADDERLPSSSDEGDEPAAFDLDAGGLGGLLSQAMEMQQQVMAAQAQAAEQLVEGQAGGGAVRVQVTGGMEFLAVQIAPEAVDPDDVEMLQDLVLAALHDAVAGVNALQAQSLGGFGDMLQGSGLGGMLGLGEPEGEPYDDEPDNDGEDGGAGAR